MKHLYKTIVKESQIVAVLEYSRKQMISQFGADNILKTAMNDFSHQLDDAGFDRKVPKNEEELLVWKQKNLPIVMELLESADQTKDKAYVQFITKIYARASTKSNEPHYQWGANIEDVTSTISEAISKFDEVKKRGKVPEDKRDYMKFRNFFEFVKLAKDLYEEFIESKKQKSLDEIEREKLKGSYKIIYADKRVKIVRLDDFKASCYFGFGSVWCTQASGPYGSSAAGHFKNKTSDDRRLYIIFPGDPVIERKKVSGSNKEVDSVEKYQINIDGKTGNIIELKDQENHTVPGGDVFVLKKRFGDISPALIEDVPALMNYIAYAPNDAIETLIDDFKRIATNELQRIVQRKIEDPAVAKEVIYEGSQIIDRVDSKIVKDKAKSGERISAVDSYFPEALSELIKNSSLSRETYKVLHKIHWFIKFRVYSTVDEANKRIVVNVRDLGE